MRAKGLILISLVLNGAMAIALWEVYHRPSQSGRDASARPLPPWVTNNSIRVAKTNVILNSRVFSWQNIESPDYERYVMNLRSIGCPESTVRDIIVADVNQVYARKRRELNTTTNDLKWWLSDPDPEESRAALNKEKALDDERRRLLTHLLGTNWEQGAKEEVEPVVLAGPVLGALTPEQKQRVQDILALSRSQVQDYIRQCDDLGETPDPAELARLREETRQELGEELNAEQLDEFLLRYSSDATQLRSELRGFNATPAEFRKLFAATDPLDRQLDLLGNDDDPATQTERARLEQERDAAIRQALTPERYDAYRSLHDPDYRAALAEAQENGASPQAGRGLYEINQAAASERQRIANDPNLTPDQRRQELAMVEREQQAARASLLGLPMPEEAANATAPANIFQHRVGPQETLAGLSLYYRVPLSDLLRANPGLDPGLIQPGSTVKIPNPPPLPWQPTFIPQR